MPDPTAVPNAARSGRALVAWVVGVQALVALTWTLYVVLLPGMLDLAGLGRSWLPVLLLVDQAVFAATDWAAGVHADRVKRAAGRLGPLLIAASVASSAALLLLPWIAHAGAPALLIGVTVIWTATSAALRAPVIGMLGSLSGDAARSRACALSLLGVGIAGAVAPLATGWLAGVDARLPIALAAVALAIAASFVLAVERPVAPPIDTGLGRAAGQPAAQAVAAPERRTMWFLAAAVLVAAIGMQLHTALLSAPLYARLNGGSPAPWMPTFWVGFALGLVAVALLGNGRSPLRRCALALAAGTLLVAIAQAAGSLHWLIAAQAGAGMAWAVFSAVALNAALATGDGQGAATPAGWLMSALALAACVRLALVTGGQQAWGVLDEAVLAAWLLGALLVAAAAMSRERSVMKFTARG